MEKYVITTPLNPRRQWNLKYYKKGIEKLKPQPEAVGIVTDKDVFNKFFKDNDLYIHVAEHPDYDLKLDRIAKGRSILKNWFMEKRDEAFQWWIDSDIEVKKDTFKTIYKRMKEINCLMYSNGYQGRKNDRNWHGIGCTVIHRSIVDIGRFYIPRVKTDDGNIKNICEDMMYFCAYTNSKHHVLNRLKPSYDKLHVKESIAPVIHHLREKDDHPGYEYKINKKIK